MKRHTYRSIAVNFADYSPGIYAMKRHTYGSIAVNFANYLPGIYAMPKEGNFVFINVVQTVIENLLKYIITEKDVPISAGHLRTRNIYDLASICQKHCKGILYVDLDTIKDLYHNVSYPGNNHIFITEDIIRDCKDIYNRFIDCFIENVDFEILKHLYDDVLGLPEDTSNFVDTLDCRCNIQNILNLDTI